ncbi:hypothetical protein EGM51_04610 [Verrucomicrobia bacterium S94]|nr:hypothetical protein EGM51_04610 [Verrucomicrobia bacterium S94]
MSKHLSEAEQMAFEYFERDLSEHEMDQLFDRLNESAELRDSFMEVARDEWLLQHSLHLQHSMLKPEMKRLNFRKKVRRVAAMAAVLLAVVSIFIAHQVRVNLVSAAETVQLHPLAKVVDFYVMENDMITLVNQGEVRELTARSRLNSGDRIVVPPGARLIFQYLNEKTAVAVAGNSLLSVSDGQRGKTIRLNHGHLKADVDKQDPSAPMRVLTDDAEAVVLGTTFEISALGYTRLAVHEGCVRLKSFLHKTSVDVSAGHLVNSFDMEKAGEMSFVQIELVPVLNKTLNDPVSDYYLIVDDDRNYSAFLAFDLGDVSERIIEARLQLTVARSQQDRWGEGLFRLHRLSPSARPGEPETFGMKTQVAYFQGQVDRDLQLEMVIDPKQLKNGINNFELSLDEGGNDCWFAPVKSSTPPRLILKVRNGPSGEE